MQTEAKVARGAAALYVASIFSLLLNTAYFVILTNFISVDEVGLVSLLNVLIIGTSSLATLALPLVGSGITATPPAVTRFLSQYIRTGEGSARKRARALTSQGIANDSTVPSSVRVVSFGRMGVFPW